MSHTSPTLLRQHLEAVAGVTIPADILVGLIEFDPQFAPFLSRLAENAERVNRTPVEQETLVVRAERLLTELQGQGYGVGARRPRRPHSKKRRRR